MEAAGSFCIQFYDLTVNRRFFKVCSKLLVELLLKTVLEVDVGCFQINFPNATQKVGEVELPYLDVPQAPVEGPEPIYLVEVLTQKIKHVGRKKN